MKRKNGKNSISSPASLPETIDLLSRLSAAHAVPGFEDEVRAILHRELSGAGKGSVDRMGNYHLRMKGKSGPHVGIDCHMDEVGFMVQSITPDGFLRLVDLGGWSPLTLSAQPMVVLGSKGKIHGAIGSVPPHFNRGKSGGESIPSIADLYVDVGARDAAEAREWGIALGTAVCPDVQPRLMHNGSRLIGKALDNRVGCAAAIQAARALQGEDVNLSLFGTVQEEGGLRGAEITRNSTDLDLMIVMEGSPADDTPGQLSSSSQGMLGRGVQIRCYDPTHITNPKLAQWSCRLADSLHIPYQVAVRRTGGTNAGKYHLGAHGIPTIVLAPPVRYIHSHLSIVDLNDLIATRELAIAMIRNLDDPTYRELLPSLG
ncbi:MAG: M42 family metallopeptidase [Opitutales bacterium]|nr:M42 family metallopeptidase [Opitutales bacterium]